MQELLVPATVGGQGVAVTCEQCLRPPRRAGGCEVRPEGPGAGFTQGCDEAEEGRGELSAPMSAAPQGCVQPNQQCPEGSRLHCEDSPCKWLSVPSAVSVGFFFVPLHLKQWHLEGMPLAGLGCGACLLPLPASTERVVRKAWACRCLQPRLLLIHFLPSLPKPSWSPVP